MVISGLTAHNSVKLISAKAQTCVTKRMANVSMVVNMLATRHQNAQLVSVELFCRPYLCFFMNILMTCNNSYAVYLFLVEACSDGTYGFDCSQTCGRCFDNKLCNKTDGVCTNGCSDGFSGTLCQTSGK